jgi:hypothetical protein
MRDAASVAALLFSVVFSIATCVGACDKREGVAFNCDCDYLTDYDDAAKQAARVCAEDPQDAIAVGKGCAQMSAPAHIRDCTCTRAAEAPSPCRRGCIE